MNTKLSTQLTLPQKWLLLPYTIIPLTLLMVVFDYWSGTPFFKSSLPSNPDIWLLWPLIFNLPHIVASVVMLIDEEYLRHYRFPLFKGAAIALTLGVGVPILFGSTAVFLTLAVYTMYHVLMQQFGLTAMMLKRRDMHGFTTFKWASVIAASCLFVLIYGRTFLSNMQSIVLEESAYILTGVSCIAACIMYADIHLHGRTSRTARFYFIASALLLPISALMYKMEYHSFAIMIPRIAHDITAYMIYATHDHNRNNVQRHNLMYRLPLLKRLPSVLLCILVSMLIAFVLTHYNGRIAVVTYAVSTLIFFHYYIEGKIWRKDTPHRRYVSFQ